MNKEGKLTKTQCDSRGRRSRRVVRGKEKVNSLGERWGPREMQHNGGGRSGVLVSRYISVEKSKSFTCWVQRSRVR